MRIAHQCGPTLFSKSALWCRLVIPAVRFWTIRWLESFLLPVKFLEVFTDWLAHQGFSYARGAPGLNGLTLVLLQCIGRFLRKGQRIKEIQNEAVPPYFESLYTALFARTTMKERMLAAPPKIRAKPRKNQLCCTKIPSIFPRAPVTGIRKRAK